jgi:cell wall-associated NlpC family hydrolase
MSMKESLSGISVELGKILQQLKDIESVQGRLSKSAGSYSRALAGAGAGTSSVGGSGFSTPPPAPGSNSGGVTPTATGAAAGGGGSGFGGAVAAAAGSLFTAGFNFLPSTQDSVAYQSMFFRSSFMGQGGYKEDDLAKMRAMFGRRQTDPFGMQTAAATFTGSGMAMGTQHFEMGMQQTATTSLLFGQSNATAAQAQASLYSGPTAGRLGNIGIFVSSLNSGDPRAFGDIVDQIWGRAYGNPNAKIPFESVQADLRGGYLGAWLRRNFGDNPSLYDQLYQAIVLKANANGRSLDYSDLTGDGKSGMSGTGPTAAMAVGRDLGLTEENDPMFFAARGYGAQAKAIEGAMDEMIGAWSASMDKLINATEKYADAMLEGNWLLESITWLKGFTQTIAGNDVLGPLAGGLFGLFTGGLLGGAKGLLGFAKGGVGTSTSDSILARLSKGEYVINARAAQEIGTEQLNALNAMGQDFGSGFASPAKAFAKGGSTTEGGIGEVVALARKYSHLPYASGATVPVDKNGNPTAWGCATSVAWLYQKGAGVTLPSPSLSYGQWKGLTQTVSESSMQPGDLIFMKNNGPSGVNKQNPVNHVEMYLGPGEIFNGGMGIQKKSSYPPVKDGVKRVMGGGSSVGSGTPVMEDAAPTTAEGGSAPALGLLPVSSSLTAQSPHSFSLGGFTGGAQGLSLGMASSFSWVGGSLFSVGTQGSITGAQSAEQESEGSDPAESSGEETMPATGGVGTGSGGEWLYNYLVSKGLRGNTLKKAWVIGMRESSGNPNLQSKDKYRGSWTSAGRPHYDVGLFQINNRHLPTVQKRYGGDMRQMLDLEKNYDMTTYMSNNWNNLLAWALESDGQTFNWSMYNPYPSWAGASMSNHKRLWGLYDKYNTQNYSEGAYRTHEGMAKIHEGEMVLPANVAERFREMMRDAGGPQSRTQGDVNITLKIERASDEEAERFARKVKKLLEQDSWETAMRTR